MWLLECATPRVHGTGRVVGGRHDGVIVVAMMAAAMAAAVVAAQGPLASLIGTALDRLFGMPDRSGQMCSAKGMASAKKG